MQHSSSPDTNLFPLELIGVSNGNFARDAYITVAGEIYRISAVGKLEQELPDEDGYMHLFGKSYLSSELLNTAQKHPLFKSHME